MQMLQKAAHRGDAPPSFFGPALLFHQQRRRFAGRRPAGNQPDGVARPGGIAIEYHAHGMAILQQNPLIDPGETVFIGHALQTGAIHGAAAE